MPARRFTPIAALAAASAAALIALTAGCASPTPPPVLLTLPPLAGAPTAPAAAASAPTGAASAPTLVVRRVAIPEYLVARRVRFRADPSTLAEWPNTYWAERIEIGVSREFVSALRAQLPGWTLCDSSCGEQPATLTLQVDLVPMDYLRSTQKLQARARLTVTDNGAPARVLRHAERGYDIAAPADTAQGQAQAIARLIEQVAAEAAPLVRAARP